MSTGRALGSAVALPEGSPEEQVALPARIWREGGKEGIVSKGGSSNEEIGPRLGAQQPGALSQKSVQPPLRKRNHESV